MPKVFSRRTLEAFEDASASIPLRQLDPAFERVGIRPGVDPGGPAGSRKTQFRRYIAGVDQGDPQQLGRLGAALGALIDEVATSKQEFLVKAAERDGFAFVDGVFRPAEIAPRSFAITRVDDLASIDDRGRRLYLLANDRPNDAVAGAKELVESLCRTVLRLIGEPAPKKTAGLVDIAKATLDAIELVPPGIDDAKKRATLVRACLQQHSAIVANLGEWKGLPHRHARLAIGAAITFAGFVAETYLEPSDRVRGG